MQYAEVTMMDLVLLAYQNLSQRISKVVGRRRVANLNHLADDQFLNVMVGYSRMFDISQALHFFCSCTSSKVVLIDQCRLILILRKVSQYCGHPRSVAGSVRQRKELGPGF